MVYRIIYITVEYLIFPQYLLIRPHPSLRILFTSPSLRVPGILQSPFLNKIGGSLQVRNELTEALAEGRGVTAKVRWVCKAEDEGRYRWIHCTPLLGSNGRIGVWMVVLVDEEQEINRRWRRAPPVDSNLGQSISTQRYAQSQSGGNGEYFPSSLGRRASFVEGSASRRGANGASSHNGSIHSSSPHI